MNPDPKHNPERNPAALVEVTRGPIVESVHYGVVAVADVEGNLMAWAGNPGTVTYYRSASKPLQAISLVESELGSKSMVNCTVISPPVRSASTGISTIEPAGRSCSVGGSGELGRKTAVSGGLMARPAIFE